MTLAFAHAVLAIVVIGDPLNPLQAFNPDLAQKTIVAQPAASAVFPIEKHWNFEVKNYVIEHHQGFQPLNVTIDYRSNQGVAAKADALYVEMYAETYAEMDDFLTRYPNEDDYWEVVNRELAKTLLRTNPDLASVSITLEVLPTEHIPYDRASIVTQSRSGLNLQEWRFTTRVPVQVQGSDLSYEVEYLYRDGITNTEYPDFVPISNRTAQLLMAAMTQGEPWEYTNQTIAESILHKYPALDSFTGHLVTGAKGGRRMTDGG